MRKLPMAYALVALTCCLSTLPAQEHTAEPIAGAPQDEDVSADWKQFLADQGILVKRGSRTVCEIWLSKAWPVAKEFEATDELLYPFEPGQLIGILHYRRRGSDFRDQSISSGWYSLRYGLQPIDGNHEGTSPTRDFLVLVNLENDQPEKEWDGEALQEASAEAAGSTHPAMICLQRAVDAEPLSVRHDEAHDWWILHAVGKAEAGGEPTDLAVDMVVAGHAVE